MERPAQMLAALFAAGAMAAGVIGMVPTRDAPRAGQIVFVPWGADALGPADPSSSVRLVLQGCEDLAQGLRVRGRLTGTATSSVVGVEGGLVGQAGVRIGRADLRDQYGVVDSVGAFDVPIPWMQPAAAAAPAGPLVGGDEMTPFGPPTRCPHPVR
jgi:hypothetical protein